MPSAGAHSEHGGSPKAASSSSSQSTYYSRKLSQLVKPLEKRKPQALRKFMPVINKKVDVSNARSHLDTGVRLRPIRRVKPSLRTLSKQGTNSALGSRDETASAQHGPTSPI